MADVKVSGLPADSSVDAGHYVVLNDPTGPTTRRGFLSVLADYFFNQTNIPAGSGSPVTRGDEMFSDFVASGLVWSGDAYASTRNASMTSGIVYINGRRISITSVSARSFTASKDTYVDVLDNGDGTGTLVYTEVTNNAASPALATNSIRIAIIVAGASNIAGAGSVNQGQLDVVLPIASSSPYQVTDSLGNLICNRSPNPTLIGRRQLVANFSTTNTAQTDVTGMIVPFLAPGNRNVRITAWTQRETASGSSGGSAIYLFIVEASTTLAASIISSPGNNYNLPNTVINFTRPSAGLHTYKLQVAKDAAGTLNLIGVTDSPLFLSVELV